MVFFSTPFTFVFVGLYLFLLIFMFSTIDFYFYWLFIEIRTLVFMGVGYSIYKNNFSQLLLFFIIQTIAAFFILVFYVYEVNSGLSASLLLKLSMFPFYFWYFDLVSMFPNFLFFFSRTVFKIPSILIFSYFMDFFYIPIIILRSVLTILLGSVVIVFSNDFRFILLASSVANNSWFIFSQITGLFFFSVYLTIYSFFLFLRINSMSNLFTSSLVKSLSNRLKMKLVIPFIVLSGMPPFPLFFIKVFVIINLILSYSLGVYLILALLANVVMLLGYLKSCFFLLVNQQSNRAVFFYSL